MHTFNMLGIKTARFQRCVKGRDLALRICRLTDLPALYHLFNPEILPNSGGTPSRGFGSLLSFLAWMRSTFRIIYLIEVQEESERRIVGFSGLYNILAGQSLWLSLAIFRRDDRGRGYGRQALELLLHALQENGAAGRVVVEVSRSNIPSLRLFEKAGFEPRSQSDERLILQKCLSPRGDSGSDGKGSKVRNPSRS